MEHLSPLPGGETNYKTALTHNHRPVATIVAVKWCLIVLSIIVLQNGLFHSQNPFSLITFHDVKEQHNSGEHCGRDHRYCDVL